MWEPLYKKFSSYLDIPNRIEILNKRLDILKVSGHCSAGLQPLPVISVY